MRHRTNGKVIVITGASSGMGKGAARAFAEMGASLVLAARREHLLHDLADECQAIGGQAIVVPADVAEARDMDELARAAVEEFGGIDVWINNAGVGAIGRFEEMPLAEQIGVIETNLIGTISGSYFAMRQFRRQGFGTLINIASAVGKIPAPYYAAYTASKFGIVGFSGSLRQELRENNMDNIHVCTVMPMAMDTPFFDHASNYTGREVQPIPPLYDPCEVVDTLVRLVERPRDEVIVGSAGKFFNLMHHVAPGTTERMMARQTHKAQFDETPPSRNSAGSVREPVDEGVELHAGRLRARDGSPYHAPRR